MKIIFHQEISHRKSYGEKLSKYVTAFDYTDKVLIFLSTTTGGVSIFLFKNIVGAPVGIASVIFTLIFSFATAIIKKLLNITRSNNKKKKTKKKHDKILMLAKSKLNSIETLISQALIGMNISHEEFVTTSKEKDKYEKMKDSLRSEDEKSYKIMRLSRVKLNTSND